jgi:hypothetical protein
MAASSISSQIDPFPLPEADAATAVWQKFIKDSAEKLAGVDPEEARLFCLGDKHTEEWQKAWRGGVIDHYGSDGDIVLIEGLRAGASLPYHPFLSVQKKVDVLGWDDVDLIKDTKTAIRICVSLNEKYQERDPTSKWSKEDRASWDEAYKKIQINCLSRTKILIKTARKYLKNIKSGQKLFIIAGSDHFYNKDGVNIVNYIKGVKLALILPKEISQNSDENYAYVKKIMG